MMKSQDVLNNNMFIHGPTFPIKIKRKISIEDWELFEKLADETKSLWEIFWAISKDKNNIKNKNICAVYYLEEYVLPNLGPTMKHLVMNGLVDNKGLSIILSLFIKMIPKEKCQNCDCKMTDEDWINKI